jgi:hypothetical protein
MLALQTAPSPSEVHLVTHSRCVLFFPHHDAQNVDTRRLVEDMCFTNKAIKRFSCASVNYTGVLLTHGKWYFEMTFDPSWCVRNFNIEP